MRFFEISSGLRLPVSLEEQEILDMMIERRGVDGASLPERELEVARNMVSRGLLNRTFDGDKVIYQPNSLLDLWRL